MSDKTSVNDLHLHISDIKLRIVDGGTDGLVAWASCVLSMAIKLDNIAIRRGADSQLFLTYPAKQSQRGSRHYYFNPISAEAAGAVEDAVLARLAMLVNSQTTVEEQD